MRWLPGFVLIALAGAGCYDDALLAPHDLACGCFCASSAATPTAVNLTAEGDLDWVHFGAMTSPPEMPDDRKAGGSGDIGPLVFSGAAGDLAAYPNNGVPFSWTDGTPDVTSPSGGSFTGIKMVGEGEALSGSVAAAATPRTAKVFVDSYVAQARFQAQLDDGSAPAFSELVDNTDARPGGTTREFAIRFCSPNAGAHLTFTWSVVLLRTCPPAEPNCGRNVALQAVALSSQ